LARKGTRQLKEEGAGPASQAWREAVARSRTAEGAADAPEQWEPEVWVRDEDDVRAAPPSRAARRSSPTTNKGTTTASPEPTKRKPKKLPGQVNNELSEAVSPAKVARLQERLADATGAYERDRYRDAARMLKPLAEQAPGAAAVRELYGLAHYRLSNWNAAITELEAFRALSDSYDQHPTLADCYRAKKRWREADALWEELRRASPGPELMAEGRIVHAGTLADRGRIAEAIDLLEKAKTEIRKPRPHHLRTWYALADLYERAGEVPRARELFKRILDFDADLYDTAERLAGIG
jgi:tetratricopeptide (TPR) repeat protein